MVLKMHSLLRDSAKLREGENLKSATVCKNGSVPTHEAVKSPKLLDDFLTRPHMEVVGIAKNDLRSKRSEFIGRDGLDSGLSAHRHEDGRLHVGAPGVQDPSPSLARRIGLKKGEGRFRTHRDKGDKWDDRGNKK